MKNSSHIIALAALFVILIGSLFMLQRDRPEPLNPDYLIAAADLEVEIYTTPMCGYCKSAKKLLTKHGLEYKEYNVHRDLHLRQAMKERSGGRKTVPQIFINEHHVGGYNDLRSWNRTGKLENMIQCGKPESC